MKEICLGWFLLDRYTNTFLVIFRGGISFTEAFYGNGFNGVMHDHNLEITRLP